MEEFYKENRLREEISVYTDGLISVSQMPSKSTLKAFEISIADFGDARGATDGGRIHFVRGSCSTDRQILLDFTVANALCITLCHYSLSLQNEPLELIQ